MENVYSKYLEGIKVPDNIEIDNSPYSKYLPSEERQKFKITTKGNRGSNLTYEDMTEPGEKSYDLNPYAKYLKGNNTNAMILILTQNIYLKILKKVIPI